MIKLNKSKLRNITGGEITVWGCIAVATIVVFVSGVIKGYTHPKRCNNE